MATPCRRLAPLALALLACRRDAAVVLPARVDANSPRPTDAPPATAPGVTRPRPVALRALDGTPVQFALPSPDGRRIAVGTRGVVTLFATRDGAPLRRYAVPALEWMEPRWIGGDAMEVSVVDRYPNTARVRLDLATGRLGPVSPRAVGATDASADGGASPCELAPDEGAPRRYRAWGDLSGRVHVVDCDVGERFVLGEFVENAAAAVGVMTGGVEDLAWSSDGRSLAVVADGVRVWDVARRTGRLVSRGGRAAVWRPGTRELTVIERRSEGDNLARLAANGDWRVDLTPWREGRMRFAWSADGARLATISAEGLSIHEVERDAGDTSEAVPREVGDPVELRWSTDGSLVAAFHGGALLVWRDGRVAWSYLRRPASLTGASLSPDRRWLAYRARSDTSTTLVVWDLTRGRLAYAGRPAPPPDGGPADCTPTDEGWTADSALRVRCWDASVFAFRPETRAVSWTAAGDGGGGHGEVPDAGEGAAWRRDGAELARCEGAEVVVASRLRSGRAGPVVWRTPLDGAGCEEVAWSNEGTLLLAAGVGALHVVRRRDGARVRLEVHGEGAAARGIVLAPHGAADADDDAVSLLHSLDGAPGDPRDRGLLARLVAASAAP